MIFSKLLSHPRSLSAVKFKPYFVIWSSNAFTTRSAYSHHPAFHPISVTNTWVKKHYTNKLHYRTFLQALIQEPATGHNLPGQGLKKYTEEEEKILEEKSIVLRFLNRKIAQQNEGRKKFSVLPDYRFFIQFWCWAVGLTLLGSLVGPDIKSLLLDVQESPSVAPAYKPVRPDSFLVFLYTSLPLRFLSRICGRIMKLEITPSCRKLLIGAFCWLTEAKIEEASEKNMESFKSISAFFTRSIDPALRPVDQNAKLVSPSDGKVLISGKVVNGEIEQVKGITYSLRKFLGPLQESSIEVTGDDGKVYMKDLNVAPERDYQKALMHDPEKNDLYQCVIYLAPGDYHRFHSPCEWVLKNRRHFPGELLSVNPKIASWVKNLFVVNERVVLSGAWEHGYFSMTAVGATSVGSIKVFEDLMLKTNQRSYSPGSFYDFLFDEQGINMKKADPVGEFNFGSTIVLVFEAPKEYNFDLENGKQLKFGEKFSLTKD